jgi:2-haloacid dehalogenase
VLRLQGRFELLITAEDLCSYKPRRAHFDAAVDRLRLPKERILHVASSLFHDVRPSSALGWAAAWINRDGDPRPPDAHPRWETRDLASLADLLGC